MKIKRNKFTNTHSQTYKHIHKLTNTFKNLHIQKLTHSKTYTFTNLQKMLSKEIKERIIIKINLIKEGYEIVEYEEDGCDKYGVTHWAFCMNGQSSRSWNIPSMCEDSINVYLKNILEIGLEHKGEIYYFDSKLITGNICDPEFELSFITKEQFEEKKQKKQLMKNYVEQYLEKKNEVYHKFIEDFEKSEDLWYRKPTEVDYNYKLNKIKKFVFIDAEKFKKDTQKLFINGWDRIIKEIGDLIPESKGILV